MIKNGRHCEARLSSEGAMRKPSNTQLNTQVHEANESDHHAKQTLDPASKTNFRLPDSHPKSIKVIAVLQGYHKL